MDNQQMELGFGTARARLTATRRQRRLTRASWWFERMRQAVDRAFDRAAVTPRPEQIWFPNARREIILRAPRYS
jgi:hypothetical protein